METNLIGKVFGRLTVIKCITEATQIRKRTWLCKCSCGIVKTVTEAKLKYSTRSCGCLRKEKASRALKKLLTKHGLCRSSFYRSWNQMKQRCTNKNNKRYKNYGCRGIIYDPKWNEFENFYTNMYFKYLYAKKQLKIRTPSIERINVNKSYCFSNCIFIEHINQSKNRTSNREFISVNPITNERIKSNNQHEIARQFNLNVGHINSCLRKRLKYHKKWIFYYT